MKTAIVQTKKDAHNKTLREMPNPDSFFKPVSVLEGLEGPILATAGVSQVHRGANCSGGTYTTKPNWFGRVHEGSLGLLQSEHDGTHQCGAVQKWVKSEYDVWINVEQYKCGLKVQCMNQMC
jgi:hypothetical protein